MLAKFKNRINATRFDFTVHVHSLQPWPSGNKAIAIGWQRGKRRRGATNSVFPLPTPDKSGTVVRFNDKFNLTSTLYKAPGADRNSQTGPYKKKCLILAILETDGRTHATAALGRVVIDLSEFASIDGQELRTFQVACNKSIHAAVGEPQLTLTIRCRWKKAGADMTEDEVASMSTDTTGSGLTSNLRDFFARATKPRGGSGSGAGAATGTAKSHSEQDLGGFGGGGGVDPAMETIGEEDGGDGAAHAAVLDEAYREADEAAYGSPLHTGDGANGGWHAQQLEYGVAGTFNLHDDEDYQQRDGSRSAALVTAAVAVSPAPPRTSRWRMEAMGANGDAAPGAAAPLAVGGGDLGGGAAASPGPERLRPSRRVSHRATQTDAVATVGRGSRRVSAASGVLTGAGGFDDAAALQDELLTAAAVEFAIYNAQRPLVTGRLPGRGVHAPARRIARTLVCLGRVDGLPFGELALRQIRASAVGRRHEAAQLAFWWTNCCHLRGFLQSLNLALPPADPSLGPAAGVQRHWASAEFVPKLLVQEKAVFDELVSFMWTDVLVPVIAASRASAAAAARARANGGGPPPNRRAHQEAALRKWVDAFDSANKQLRGLGRDGHCATLRHQVLLELLKRVDILLLHYLLSMPAPDEDRLLASADGAGDGTRAPSAAATAGEPLMDPVNPNLPVLDDSMLFFTRGSLTFGTGMQLKMACTRFQQWAFGEGGLRDIWSQLPETGQVLFPLLKGAADLLMMPKGLLLDEGIRTDMCAHLSLPTLVYMCSRFTPDEYAAEGLPPRVLAALRAEAGAVGSADCSRPPVLEVEAECAYYSPTDDMVMAKVETGEEPGLEYDADSEAELDALGALSTGSGNDTSSGPPPLRFRLLHNLWSAGVPRERAITIARDV